MVRPENPYPSQQGRGWGQEVHNAWQQGADAQLRAVVEWLEQFSVWTTYPYPKKLLDIPKDKWEALKAELEEAPE